MTRVTVPGGEELAVVLPETTLDCARDRAEQMRRAIRDTNLTHAGQTLPGPTASFGVAVYPADGAKPAELLKAADQALYRAKKRVGTGFASPGNRRRLAPDRDLHCNSAPGGELDPALTGARAWGRWRPRPELNRRPTA
ncbi:MAG: GGDEF domain-containing protein [Gammaproteobacteria bacterium]|nr:MAG: GGDEF domain-containing protein [Gammaproteobacteria bacterium]